MEVGSWSLWIASRFWSLEAIIKCDFGQIEVNFRVDYLWTMKSYMVICLIVYLVQNIVIQNSFMKVIPCHEWVLNNNQNPRGWMFNIKIKFMFERKPLSWNSSYTIHSKKDVVLITKTFQIISQIRNTRIPYKFTRLHIRLTFSQLLTFWSNSWPKSTRYSNKPCFYFFFHAWAISSWSSNLCMTFGVFHDDSTTLINAMHNLHNTKPSLPHLSHSQPCIHTYIQHNHAFNHNISMITMT